jgi:anaerobic selenocysteine-containing dehydrogenase
MMILESCNILGNCCPDPNRMYDFLAEMEFVVGADPVLNPTISAFADIVVPIAMGIERDTVRSWWTPIRACSKITQYYEAKDDETFAIELINRLHPGKFDEVMKVGKDLQNIRLHESATGEKILGPIIDEMYRENIVIDDGKARWAHHKNEYDGVKETEHWDPSIDFDMLKIDKCGYLYDEFCSTYYKYEKGMLRDDGNPGFNTTTGRIELYSLKFQAWGASPVPIYVEPHESPLATPDKYEQYPLIAITGVRSYEFFHGEHRNLPTMREFHPWPVVCMNQTTAEKFGIEDGQWIWIANERGRFTQVAQITPGIKDGTITTEHGWWYPETDSALPNLYRTFDSNPNNCIDLDRVGIWGIGSSQKTTLVTIYPRKEGDILPTEQVIQYGGFAIEKAFREAKYAEWKAKGITNN